MSLTKAEGGPVPNGGDWAALFGRVAGMRKLSLASIRESIEDEGADWDLKPLEYPDPAGDTMVCAGEEVIHAVPIAPGFFSLEPRDVDIASVSWESPLVCILRTRLHRSERDMSERRRRKEEAEALAAEAAAEPHYRQLRQDLRNLAKERLVTSRGGKKL